MDEREEKQKKRKKIKVNGKTLKVMASLFLTIFYVSRIVIQNGMMQIGNYSSSELADLLQNNSKMSSLSGYASVLEIIGYMAIPIFAFLLTEGFLYTSNYKKYLFSVSALAVISEIPYDFAVHGSFFDLTSQNVACSSLMALLMLFGLDYCAEKGGLISIFEEILLVAATVIWSVFFKCSFGAGMVLLSAGYYLFRKTKFSRLMVGCALGIMYYSAPLSSLLLWVYDGERGNIKNKYLYYAFYPILLVILGMIAKIV